MYVVHLSGKLAKMCSFDSNPEARRMCLRFAAIPLAKVSSVAKPGIGVSVPAEMDKGKYGKNGGHYCS